jgi:hypothetical protein
MHVSSRCSRNRQYHYFTELRGCGEYSGLHSGMGLFPFHNLFFGRVSLPN